MPVMMITSFNEAGVLGPENDQAPGLEKPDDLLASTSPGLLGPENRGVSFAHLLAALVGGVALGAAGMWWIQNGEQAKKMAEITNYLQAIYGQTPEAKTNQVKIDSAEGRK